MVADANLACMQSKKALFSRYRERKFGVFRLGSVSINRAFSAGSKQTLSRGGRGRKTRRDQEGKKMAAYLQPVIKTRVARRRTSPTFTTDQ